MNYIEYVKNVLRTESPKNPFTKEVEDLGLNYRLYHGILGINTEIGEILEAYDKSKETGSKLDYVNLGEETGDILWYIGVISNVFGIEKELYSIEISDKNVDINHFPAKLEILANTLLDMTKKTMFYGKQLEEEKVKKLITEIFVLTNIYINSLGIKVDSITFENVMDTNIKKLKKRYPEKFNDENAENRNLKEERKILENGMNM